jgi:hypothetical protein
MNRQNSFNAVSAETKVVKAGDEAAIALMRRAYHDIYVPAFPIEDERDSLEKIESRLQNPVNGVKRVILLAGKHLDDPAKAQVYGISIAYYYSTHQAGLLAYNAIAPEYQQMGLGRLMVQGRIKGLEALAAESGQTLKSVIIEVNDPAKVKPEDDSMDPAKRVALFEKWGARKIPVPYAQPALAQGQEKCHTVMLMAYPLEGKYPQAEGVKAFVEGIYAANNNGPVDYRADPDFRATQAAIDAWGGFGPDAAVLPAAQPDSAPAASTRPSAAPPPAPPKPKK